MRATSLIDPTVFAVAWKSMLLLAAVFWLAVAYWVHRDARRRLDDPWLAGTATLLGLIPLVGAPVYMLFRPQETLADERLQRLEVRALEQRLSTHEEHCPVCRTGVEPGYRVCPVCSTRLKQSCGSCDAALEPLWQICPYCATPAGATVVHVDIDAALTAEARAVRREPQASASAGLS